MSGLPKTSIIRITPKILLYLKVFEDEKESVLRKSVNSNGINKKTIKHAYHGEINRKNKAVGYHHKSMMSGSRIIPGTEEVPDINGVYRAKVEVKGVKKVAKSSFFPKEWDRVKVYNTISKAYKNKK
ncbi:EndoU domain-containing protein [Bacillus subtilis]|uniref:EndoU domain-containing protein n=1 Tax=Bacillus subtilis TaxID=1423 RepID=UPI002DB86A01|nr:EndoU domain-containing protein [Bacillus subtilis]MEC1582471.1 EndoU domain-containing protein [Bacillus subtilis]